MAAKLQGRKAGTLEARQIVCIHIGEALSALKSGNASDHSIHEARRAIKKARAVWRLLRPGLPEATYRQVNGRLRNAGRPLGAARDAKIMIVALDKLLARSPGAAIERRLDALRRTLLTKARAIKRAVRSEPAGLARSGHALRVARQHIRNIPIARHGWATLGKGLRRVYRHGRRMYFKAREERRPEHLHEWRKQAKYLHHQLTILKPLWEGPIGKLSAETADLADKLGDDHDLEILRQEVCASNAAVSIEAQRKIITLIERERRRLQVAAFMLGARIYEEKPADFFARFGGYWQEWRDQKKNLTGR